MPPKNHTPFKIENIGDAEALIGYAVGSQLSRLAQRATDITDAKIAAAIGMRRDALWHAMHGDNGTRFKDEHLKQLDEVLVALGMADAGGLSALAVRLRGRRDSWTGLDVHIPPGWAAEMLAAPSSRELPVLIQAAALVAKLRAAHEAGRPAHYEFEQQIGQVVERLILIGAAPPTRRNVEALVLLGNLAGYAFDLMEDKLETAIKSPLGFRVWRAITKSVLLNAQIADTQGQASIAALKAFVSRLLEQAEDLRADSLYPGRSLDMELAIAVPAAWSPGQGAAADQVDWAAAALRARARNEKATLRERGTAAFGLWQRAAARSSAQRAVIEQELRALIEEFRSTPDRPDVATGMRWLADTLEHTLDADPQTFVCNTWPENDQPWFRTVMNASARLSSRAIPETVKAATKTLFEHALLQNAGVHRRQAIDTLVAAGWAGVVTPAFAEVLEKEKQETWLRIRALFALGFLQHRSPSTEQTLIEASRFARHRLAECRDPALAPSLVTEMHAVLFAIGDCFGARGAERGARTVRHEIRDILTGLVTTGYTDPPAMWPIARATAYLLTVTAQPREAGSEDLSETLLKDLRGHKDGVTGALSKWALDFRFADDGTIRPLLDAARLDRLGRFDPGPLLDSSGSWHT